MHKVHSLFWIVVGVFFLMLALIGLLLPVLPMVPFLIVAAFAFGKGSPRTERWILEHRHLGPPVKDWRHYGAIAFHIKVFAIVMMACSLIGGLVFSLPPLALVAQAIVLSLCALFVATRPGRPFAGEISARPKDNNPFTKQEPNRFQEE